MPKMFFSTHHIKIDLEQMTKTKLHSSYSNNLHLIDIKSKKKKKRHHCQKAFKTDTTLSINDNRKYFYSTLIYLKNNAKVKRYKNKFKN